MAKRKLDPYTLRWASRLLKREAKQLRGVGEAECWTVGAAQTLLEEARAIERKPTKPKGGRS